MFLCIASSVNLTAFLTSPKFWVCGTEDEAESKSEIHQHQLLMLLPTMITPVWARYYGQSCRWADEPLVHPGIQLVKGQYGKQTSWNLSFCSLDAQDLLGWKLLPSRLLHQAPNLPEEVW